jgi:hypothetical protein
MEQTVKVGIPIVYGVREAKPITGAPPGLKQIWMREHQQARLFVFNLSFALVEEFYLVDLGDTWLACCKGTADPADVARRGEGDTVIFLSDEGRVASVTARIA